MGGRIGRLAVFHDAVAAFTKRLEMRAE